MPCEKHVGGSPASPRAVIKQASPRDPLLSLLALGAIMLVLGSQIGAGRRPPTSRPDLAELVVALAAEPTRPVHGRLTGGFAYAPMRERMRGGGRFDFPPAVWMAAAQLEKQAGKRPTAQNHAALGTVSLVIGEWDKAVEFLEEAVHDDPGNAAFQSDLAAAYLARAAEAERAEDWVKGLASSERAIRIDSRRPEPYFNRAIAFRGLHLTHEELEAWDAYFAVDPIGPWSAEAAQHQHTLRQRRDSRRSLPERGLDHLAVREDTEDRLLAEWAAATTRREAAAARLPLEQAERKAEALSRAGGDTMPRDAVTLIRRLERAGAYRQILELASGHTLYARARQQFLRDNLKGAAELMSQAARYFSAANSPYAHWAPIYHAFFLRHQKKPDLAFAQLRTIPTATLPDGYHNLRGRVAWTEGVLWGASGRYDLEREPMKRAIAEFQIAGEHDNVIATQAILAEAEWFLGDESSAWSNIRAALALADRQERPQRSYHFTIGALMATGSGLPEAAQALLNARIRVSTTPRSTGEALLQRARLLASIGREAAALSDLARASHVFSTLDDPGLRQETSADVEIARAELFSRSDCRRAIDHANAALPAVALAAHSIRIVGLLAIRAKCRESLGDVLSAKQDLAAAASAFESRRAGFTSASARIHAFEQEREAFKDLLTVEVVRLNDEAAGLRTAERARAGVLADTWEPGVDATDPARLPPNAAIVYYESLDDRVITWVVTRARRVMLSRPIGAAALRRMVSRIQRAITRGADLEALRSHSDEFYTALVAPALELADREVGASASSSKPTVFFIPDGPLFAVPFGALPDTQGQPLIRSRTVGVAPSLAAFLAASERLSTFVPSDVLAIGDGSDPASTGSPRLPGADDEATTVGRLYPKRVVLTGSSATKDRVLRERSSVIHFAGHTVVNARFPMLSHMLLSPNAIDRDPGRLFASEITRERFDGTRVVVLATCDGAVGRVVDGEGAISVARAFFAAGVPAVVASLWPVADDLPPFAQTFHRELTASRDAAYALRRAQLAVLDRRGTRTPVSVWGGFIMFGGLGPLQ